MKSLQILLFLLTVLCLPGVSQGASLQLIQGGWAVGGPLQISFTGEDSDLDGWLEHSELSTFQAVYDLSDGNSNKWSIYDLEPDGFAFSDPDNFLIFASNAEYSLVDVAFEGEVLASVFDRNLFPVDETQAVPKVVPEPTGMVWVGITAMIGFMCLKNRKKLSLPLQSQSSTN